MRERQIEGVLSPWLRRLRFRKALPFLGRRVLDVGCGRGALCGLLPADVFYVGVDEDEAAIREARRRWPARPFFCAALSDLEKYANEAAFKKPFDSIAMLAVIEHFREPGRALGGLRRLLGSGGRLVLTTPSPLGIRVHAAGSRLGLFSREAAEEHHQSLGRRKLFALLSRAGLRAVFYKRFSLGMNQLVIAQRAEKDAG